MNRKSSIISLVIIYIFVGVIVIFQYNNYVDFKNQMESFKNKGKRFTAKDGQQLCERIKELERQLKIEEKPCEYN